MAFTVAAMRQQTAGQPVTALHRFENWSTTARTAGARIPKLASRVDDGKPRQTGQRFSGAMARVEAAVGTSADAAHAARIGVQDVGKEAIERIGELLRKR